MKESYEMPRLDNSPEFVSAEWSSHFQVVFLLVNKKLSHLERHDHKLERGKGRERGREREGEGGEKKRGKER